MKRSRKGQSTLEYVIILAAIVGAIIAFSISFKSNLTSSYNELGNEATTKINDFSF